MSNGPAQDVTESPSDSQDKPEDSPAQVESADASVDSSDPLAALRQTADENWNRYLRAAAELDNVRKRAAKDVQSARRQGIERLAVELLAVRDSLEAGIEAARTADAAADSPLLEGTEATLKLLDRAFDKVNLKEINPVEDTFDPEVHEAMSMVSAPGAAPGAIVAVIQKGFSLEGRLLRPARVVVAQAEPDAQ